MACTQCDCEEIGWIDEGIGVYEYWGAIGVDIDMVAVCADCGAYVTPEISYEQWRRYMDEP
jgi:hypothetical protein